MQTMQGVFSMFISWLNHWFFFETVDPGAGHIDPLAAIPANRRGDHRVGVTPSGRGFSPGSR